MQPGSLKLGTYLIDGKTIAMYTAGVVRSVTYKATLYGPNIPKAEAIANSDGRGSKSSSTRKLPRLPSMTSRPRIGTPPHRRRPRRLAPRLRMPPRRPLAAALAVALAVAVAVPKSHAC